MYTLIYISFLHFVADFLLQSREMGKRKSQEMRVLIEHLSIQFVVMAVGLLPFYGKWAVAFALLNALIHGVIDWNIWRGYKFFTHRRLMKEAAQSVYMNGNLNIPFEERRIQSYNDRVRGFQYWEDHWFYATIGLDQLLHMATLLALAGTVL